MKLIREYHVQNTYSASNWAYEDTYKLVYQIEDTLFEVGYFVHYKTKEDLTPLEYVIELPSSLGCPIRCAFCASSLLEYKRILFSDELMMIFMDVIERYKLKTNETILISFTGIGDFSKNYEEVIDFMNRISLLYENISFTVSSCQWSDNLFEIVKKSCLANIKIRYLQITYVGEKDFVLNNNLIPTISNDVCNLSEIVANIKESTYNCFRINYVVISGVNDSDDDFRAFAEEVRSVSNKIIVRVSRMNSTNASKKNKLAIPDMESLKRFDGILNMNHIPHYLFYADKDDNMNCGQLISECNDILYDVK